MPQEAVLTEAHRRVALDPMADIKDVIHWALEGQVHARRRIRRTAGTQQTPMSVTGAH